MRLGSLPRLSTSARRATGGLALFGGLIGTSSLKVTIHSLHSLDCFHHSCLDTSGPFVDAVHNQALLEYDVFPLTLGLAHTSWIVPPLLALAYSMLGALLPSLLEAAMGHGGFEPLIAVSSTMPRSSGRRAALAVTTTVGIIKASETLVLSSLDASWSVAALSKWPHGAELRDMNCS